MQVGVGGGGGGGGVGAPGPCGARAPRPAPPTALSSQSRALPRSRQRSRIMLGCGNGCNVRSFSLHALVSQRILESQRGMHAGFGALLAACLVGSVLSGSPTGRMAPIKLTYFNIEGVAEKVRPLLERKSPMPRLPAFASKPCAACACLWNDGLHVATEAERVCACDRSALPSRSAGWSSTMTASTSRTGPRSSPPRPLGSSPL